VTYKKKNDKEEEGKEETQPAEEEKKVEKVEEPKVIVKTEVIGVSLDDFLGGKNMLSVKEAREANAFKEKSEAYDG